MENSGKQLAILLDTKGPEIRTIKLEEGKDVDLTAGQEFTFTTDTSVVGNKEPSSGNLRWFCSRP